MQRNIGARSFRGLKIFEPGHRDAVPKRRRRISRSENLRARFERAEVRGAERGRVRGGVSPLRWGGDWGASPPPQKMFDISISKLCILANSGVQS
jgi:hypothetical protein